MSKPNFLLARVKKALPWLITLATLGYLFLTTDMPQAYETIKRVKPFYFLLLLVLGVVLPWLLEAFSLTFLFGRLNTPISFRDDALPIRAASYVLNILHYAAAGGGMALFLKNKKGVPIQEGLSSFLFLTFIDILVLGAIIPMGFWFSGVLGPSEKAALLFAVAVMVLGFLLVLLYFRAGVNFFILGSLRGWALLSAFNRARLGDYAALFALRFLLLGLYIGVEYAFLVAFGLQVPLSQLFIAIPVVTLIGLLPISVGNLGIPQEATIRFYAPFVLLPDPRSAILAYTTLRLVTHSLARIVLGYPFLKKLLAITNTTKPS